MKTLVSVGQVLRFGVLLLFCLGIGALVIDYGGPSSEGLSVGDVAPRTLKSPRTYTYNNRVERERRVQQARDEVPLAFRHDVRAFANDIARVEAAFEAGRAGLPMSENGQPASELLPDVRGRAAQMFLEALEVSLTPAEIDALVDDRFSESMQAVVVGLLRESVGTYVVSKRSELPVGEGKLLVVSSDQPSAFGEIVEDFEAIKVPGDVRREIDVRSSLMLEEEPRAFTGASVARAVVRPNLFADKALTENRRTLAGEAVGEVFETVQRGEILLQDGYRVSASQLARIEALQATTGSALWLQFLGVVCFIGLVSGIAIQVGRATSSKFSVAYRDLLSVGVLVLLLTLLTRFVVLSSEGIAGLVGYECTPESVWFLVPVAGLSMLTRQLVSVSWALAGSLILAATAGLIMDLDALMSIYVMVSAVVAIGLVSHTRERLSVLRAGALVGLINAIMALMVFVLNGYFASSDGIFSASAEPLWSTVFAFTGGIVSSFLVLGLMPLFERVGFTTDYRMMELANLNHPLMRQLMLRAPGSYHHSVVVGSLSEAGCEAIGANALQTRVAAYFHDIGKSLKPQYYVENQGTGGNKHQGLDPYTSAAIIISHVTDGVELAKKHALPQPCIDNILMHHGTGLLKYFYAKALDEVDHDPSQVDESRFRYPGPKPNSKESGILMLADKVEAATRTIKEPTEQKFRSMVHAIINSVMADDQFELCPLTFKELYAITDAFVGVLMGIHHQRIEYGETAHLSGGVRKDIPPPPPRGDSEKVITLELPPESQLKSASSSAAAAAGDYESLDHLPGEKG